MNNKDKFNGRAKDYSSGRPAYAQAFIDDLYYVFGVKESSVIADIGSGTGILCEQLLKMGSTVYAVEPNDGMRAIAENNLKQYEKFHSVNGTAEKTFLFDNCVDFITVAQAFHWFNANAFKIECKRIIRKGGKVFLIWNTRVNDAKINTLQSEIFERYCPDFKGFSGGIKNDDERITSFFDGKFEYKEYENGLLYDREKYIKRCLSSSYSLKEGDKNYEEFLKALNGLFDSFSKDGVLTVPNKTVVYINI